MKRIGNLGNRRTLQAAVLFALVFGFGWFVIGNPTPPDRGPAPDSLIANEVTSSNSEFTSVVSSDGGLASLLHPQNNSTAATEKVSAYLAKPMSDAEHAEWTENLSAQLYSPDSAPLTAEDLAPVISGRVMTTHGWPVGGIEVTAQFRNYSKDAESNAIQSAVGTQVTTTNDDGFYAFRGLPAGIYMISTPDSGSYAPSRVEVRTGVKYADLRLKTQRNSVVRGVVTDPMGNELGGVQIMPLVKGVPAGARSDANGEFHLAVALQEGVKSFPLRLQRPGFREQRYQVTQYDLADDGSLSIAVEMIPVYEFSTVSGRVTDTDGMPVAGETVRLYSPSLKRFHRAMADDSGEFEFSHVEIVNDFQLIVRPSGPYKDFTEGNLRIDEGNLRHEIELEALATDYQLSGTIVDMEAKPVPHFSMTMQSEFSSGRAVRVTTDQYGDFRVENAPQGPVVFRSDTTPQFVISGVQLSGDDFGRPVTLVLNRGSHKLVGKVVGSDGRPIGNPRVSISASQVVEGVKSRLSSSTRTDSHGRFVFTDLGAGQHTITVNAPGYESVWTKPVIGSEKEIVVRLETNST